MDCELSMHHAGVFAALNGMQMQSDNENSICLSVCQTRDL